MEKDETKIPSCDAVLMISFGGPERPDEVMPFLENVVRGKDVPRERLSEVARHYEPFGGVSPINTQSRALLAALLNELNAHELNIPVYWGNLYWHPMLTDVLRQMADDGVRRALAFVTSAFDSYSGRRQCIEQIEQAGEEIGSEAPQVEYLREFYNHPGFIEPTAERVESALEEVPDERRAAARLIYTAHSIPAAMAKQCDYEMQLHEACRLVSELLSRSEWRLAYHSRNGRPQQQWLGPQIGDHLRETCRSGEIDDVVLVPIGFVCENIEIVYDLDVEVAALCEKLGINMVRAAAVGSHPRFVQMIRELIAERV
jgi:ferrochelatase